MTWLVIGLDQTHQKNDIFLKSHEQPPEIFTLKQIFSVERVHQHIYVIYIYINTKLFVSCRPILARFLDIQSRLLGVKKVLFSPRYLLKRYSINIAMFNINLVRMTQKKKKTLCTIMFQSVSMPGKILYKRLTNHSMKTNNLVQEGMGLTGGGV